ncbi:MAG: GGDEF domain-containing protein [Burkholderiales bacterium]|nr:GGDEF domain-containing protein [Burkholderiales bacterium]
MSHVNPEDAMPPAAVSAKVMQTEALELGFSQCVHAMERTLYATPVGWALAIWLVHGVVPRVNVLQWLALFFVGWCAGLLMLRRMSKAGPRFAKHRLGLLVVAGVDGMCWGSSVLLLMTHDQRVDAWLVIVLCGVVSVNAPTYITYPRAFRVLAAALWLTASASAVALRARFDVAPQLIAGLLVYLAMVVYTLRSISSRVIEGIRLQLENAALADQLRQSLVQVKHQASTDALTGQLNRRALDLALDGLIVEGDRRGRMFSLLMLDIDFFKHINDTHGHGVGDLALQSVAQRIAAQLRAGDLCARFGGEEFVMLLPSTDLVQACEVAERIRAKLEASPLATEPPLAITASIGVATYETGMSAEALLGAADREVYAAKRSGRNQVCPARPPRNS